MKSKFFIIGIIVLIITLSSCSNIQATQNDNRSDKNIKHLTKISFTMQEAEVTGVFDPGAWGIFSPGEWGITFRMFTSYKGEVTNLVIGKEIFGNGNYSITTMFFIGFWDGTKIERNEYENVNVSGFSLYTSWESIK